jgi:adenylate kinase
MNHDSKPHAVIFIGPPGSGKGTQSEKMEGYTHISTGDLLRAEIRNRTPIGIRCQELIHKGEMVPNNIINELLEKHFTSKILLDGYPRTTEQADWLEEKVHIEKVFFFQVDIENLVLRLTNRRVCPSCKMVYNLLSKPPEDGITCDSCNTPIVQRIDDNEEIIRNRMRVYAEETTPVIEYYKQKGLVVTLDASLDPTTIHNVIRQNLG